MRINVSSFLLCVLLTGVMCASTPQATIAQDDTVSIVRAVACRSVTDRAPADETAQFVVSDERAYVWCEVHEGTDTTLQHVYYHKGARVSTVNLHVRSERFRTWSYKSLWPGATGEWRVDIQTEDGSVLEKVAFTVVDG